MIRAWFLALSLSFIAIPASSQAQATASAKPSISDDELWIHFDKWVAALKPLPPGQATSMRDTYMAVLIADGLSREAADLRFRRINTLSRGSVEKERIYWNGAFKLGAGPSSPLRLLEEAIRKVKPGRALDAGMGRGRNATYLAANGWETHGYDMAEDALVAAQAAAKEAGVRITTVQAKHEEFREATMLKRFHNSGTPPATRSDIV
jgi:hypothetical protein